MEDIRWKQRFSNYKKALLQLQLFVTKKELNKLEEQGLIQSFEYTYELAWNVMKDLLEDQGEKGILGSRDAIRLAFRRDLIQDGENWMKMIESRIKSSHTYDEKLADEVVHDILHIYYALFMKFQDDLELLAKKSI